jgi:hypothetical protein
MLLKFGILGRTSVIWSSIHMYIAGSRRDILKKGGSSLTRLILDARTTPGVEKAIERPHMSA